MTSTSSRYEPTPEEIEQACEEVREEWSDKVYRKRAGGDEGIWVPQVYHVAEVRPR